MMKRLITICGVAVLLVAANPADAAITIDFGPANGAPDTDVQLTTQLQTVYGVTFSSTSPNGVIWHGTHPTISAFTYCISVGWDKDGWARCNPVRVDFDTPTTMASIRAYDGGYDYDTLVLNAYDSSNNLVGSDSVGPYDFAWPGETASVSASEIAYITFQATGVYSGLFFDDLTFEGQVIPAPGAILLGGIGVGLVGWLRRRRTL
jgi:hypothetical protein